MKWTETISQFSAEFTGKILHRPVIALLRKALLLFCLVYSIWLIPDYGVLLGKGSYILPRPEGPYFLNLLQYPAWQNWGFVFVGMQLIFIVLRLLGRAKKVMDILIFWITANLFNAYYLISNGGHRLLIIALLLLIFIDEDVTDQDDSKVASVFKTISNTSFLLLRIQIALVYAVSAVSKLYGSQWVNGQALHWVLQIPEFSTPFLSSFVRYPLLLLILTYSVLLYQLGFPVVVWFRKIKLPFLAFGVMLHLVIGFGMGILDFSVIMILMYLAFVPDKWALKITGKKGGAPKEKQPDIRPAA